MGQSNKRGHKKALLLIDLFDRVSVEAIMNYGVMQVLKTVQGRLTTTWLRTQSGPLSSEERTGWSSDYRKQPLKTMKRSCPWNMPLVPDL